MDQDTGTIAPEDEMAAYTQRLSEKPFATDRDIAMYQIHDGRPVIQLEGMFRLESDDVPDRLDPDEREEASAKTPYWSDETNAPDVEGCEDVVDRTVCKLR